MKRYLYCSSGNTVGLDEYLGFFEIGEDRYCVRYLEIRSDGRALRYTEQNPSDELAILVFKGAHGSGEMTVMGRKRSRPKGRTRPNAHVSFSCHKVAQTHNSSDINRHRACQRS
jgi:hypothetical protein